MTATISLPDSLLQYRRITPDGCWEWTRATCPAGYGTTWWLKKKVRVHRLVAHLVHGLDMSERFQVARHKCDNPPCFNPDHIEVGTPRDNRQDSVARGRAIRPACKRGHVLSGENVKYTSEGRRCRTCDRERLRRYAERKRAGLVGRG